MSGILPKNQGHHQAAQRQAGAGRPKQGEQLAALLPRCLMGESRLFQQLEW